LKVRARLAISSRPDTSMRRVRSLSPIERAVSASSRSGASTRPATTHARAEAISSTVTSTSAASRTASSTSWRSDVSDAATTNDPRVPPALLIGTAR
jgi:hypothetical protein